MVGTAIDTIVWSMNVIATAKIIAARTRLRLRPLADGMALLVGRSVQPQYRPRLRESRMKKRCLRTRRLVSNQPLPTDSMSPDARGHMGFRNWWMPWQDGVAGDAAEAPVESSGSDSAKHPVPYESVGATPSQFL